MKNPKSSGWVRCILAILTVFVFSAYAHAQTLSSTSYPLTIGTDSLENMSGATVAIGPGDTTVASQLIQMKDSFVFRYVGQAYTSFSVHPGGYLTLGKQAKTIGNSYETVIRNFPVIAPYFSLVGKTGSVTYKYIGTRPSRKLVIQWSLNIATNVTKGTNLFQVWLWESTGKIEFVYKNANVFPYGANIFMGTNVHGTDYITSISSSFGITYAKLVNYYDGGGFSLSKGDKLTFKPEYGNPKQPYNLSFKNIAAQSVDLQWTDSSTSETYFEILGSTDSIHFSHYASAISNTRTTKGSTCTYKVTGLSAGTKYYFRVVAATEAGLPSAYISCTVKLKSKSLSGIVKVPGDFATITAALQGIRDSGILAPVTLQLQKTYTSSAETFPLTFTHDLQTDSLHTLTVRPASDATGLKIISNNAVATVVMDNASWIIFDGRASGDTVSQLTIENDTNTNAALVLQNGSQHNRLQYCTIYCGNTDTLYPKNTTIFLGIGNDSAGNSYNTFRNCTIGNFSPVYYRNIYSVAYEDRPNSYNILDGNSIFNAQYPNVDLEDGNTDWTISGNSFYNISTPNVFNYNGWLTINDTNGGNFVIKDNYFGGTAPHCGGKMENASYYHSHGVELDFSTQRGSSIQGNIFNNFRWGYAWILEIEHGKADIGTLKGNRFGSLDSSHTIIATLTSTPISILDDAVCKVANNSISGIKFGALFWGIRSSGKCEIYNNAIGNPKFPNSIMSSDEYAEEVLGIDAEGVNNSNIHDNTICNMYSDSSVTGILVNGEQPAYATHSNVNNNLVYGLKGRGDVTGIRLSVLYGMYNGNQVTSADINSNHIHSLYGLDSGSIDTILISGIQINTGYFHPVVTNNFIHNLAGKSQNSKSSINGIYVANKNPLYAYNNMISLGLDSSGSKVKTAGGTFGIHDVNADTLKAIHNTIYIGGSRQATGSFAAPVYMEANSSGIAGNSWDTVTNNILVNNERNYNNRSDDYLLLKNIAYSNYNVYYRNDTGRNFAAFYNLKAYRKSTGTEINSIFGDPKLLHPEGNAHTTDMHIGDSSAAEANGKLVKYISTDIDGQLRSSYTPVDIGADAGNYKPSPYDSTAPEIYIADADTLKSTSSTSNRTLYNVRITDGGGIADTGTYKPRIWFRRQSPSASSWKSSAGTLVSGNNKDGVWSFTIDYSLLSITSGVNDKYQYYVVAQDKAGNLTSNRYQGSSHTNVNTQLSAPLYPYAYAIRKGISNSVKVGAGQTYTSLTNAGGLFQMLDTAFLTTDITVQITSNTNETGKYSLSAWQQDSRHKVIVMPSDTNEKVIKGGPINILGAHDFTLDGRYKDAKKHLRFKFFGPATTQFAIGSDASNNTIRNCIIDTRDLTYTINMGGGVKTGSDSNFIYQNLFMAEKDSAGGSGYCIYSGNLSSKAYSGYNTIKANEFKNVKAAITIDKNFNGDGWSITGNSFYRDAPQLKNNSYAISFAPLYGGRDTISNNYIGGFGPQCSGYWIDSNATGFEAIYAATDAADTIVISKNTIKNIHAYAAGKASPSNLFTGIHIASGNAFITNNIIGALNDTASLVPYSLNVYGILNEGTGNMVISANSIGGISDPVYTGSFAGISSRGKTNVIRNNTIGSQYANRSISLYSLSAPSSIASGIMKGVQVLHAIEVPGRNASASITGNHIYNLTNNGLVDDSSQTIGIFSAAASDSISNNVIGGLSSRNRYNVKVNGANTIGICALYSTGAQIISGNNIYGLTNADTSGTGGAAGIYSGGSAAASQVSGNFIHNFNLHSSDYSSSITGIIAAGNALYANNMISLGLDSAGNSIVRPYRIVGIEKTGKYSGSFLFNSVYTGGSAVKANGSPTYGFYSWYAGTDSVINNIFFNARLNAGAGNRNYAIGIADGTNAQFHNNIIYSLDTTGVLASVNNMDLKNLNDPRISSSFQWNTITHDPAFKKPYGDINSADLHVQDTTIAEGNGKPNYTVLTDYDGQLRARYTPADIGADAIKGTAPDTGLPYIYIMPLANTASTADRYITATVYDSKGISLTNDLPELYYKRNNAATYTKAKGKLVAGNAWINTWSFTLSGSVLGGIKMGDTIHYFVMAQDISSPARIGSAPYGAKARQVDTLIAPPARTYTYLVFDTIAPVITYTPLNNTGAKTDRQITASISDSTAVTNDGKRNPRIYYRKGMNGVFAFSSGTLTSGNTKAGKWTFTIASAKMGGLSIGDTISYFISAQDSVFPPNVSSNPAGFKAHYIDTVISYPGRLNSYRIIDTAGPSFKFTPLANTIYNYNRTLTATITDSTAIPLSGKGTPRIYYRKGLYGKYTSAAGAFKSGTAKNSTWSFDIHSSLMGGVAVDDTVYYFMVAQDTGSHPNVRSTASGLLAKSVDTITTYPASPDHYMIIDTLAPVIIYTSLPNTSSKSSVSFTARITDSTGIVKLSTYIPRIYYAKGKGGAYYSAAGTLVTGTVSGRNASLLTDSKWSFSINTSDMGGVDFGDTVYYYVIAQDQSPYHINIASKPSGVRAYDVNNIITDPAKPAHYVIKDSIAPVITFTYLKNTDARYSNILAAHISNATGIATGTLGPKIYYRRGAHGNFVSAYGKLISGDAFSGDWNFDIRSSAITGGLDFGDTVQYFVVAQNTSRLNFYVVSNAPGVKASDVNTITSPPSFLYSYQIIDNAGPQITYSPLMNTYSLRSDTLVADITDSSAVPLSGSFTPKVYYRNGAKKAYKSVAGSLLSGDGYKGKWKFVFDTTGMSVSIGDTMFYHVVAQNTTKYNFKVNSSAGAITATDVNTIARHPASPSYYRIIDTSGPVISYAKFSDTTARDSMSLFVTIRDNSGVPTSGIYAPRMYFRKNRVRGYMQSGGPLWKGNGKNGLWRFTMFLTSLGKVTAGDTFYYFVAAQDISPQANISSEKPGAKGKDINTLSANPSAPDYFVIVDHTPPVIDYVPFADTISYTGTDSLTATIKDTTGIPLTGSYVPRMYYRKGLHSSWVSSGGTLKSGTTYTGKWNFKLDTAAIGGLSRGDSVYYYVIAQDKAAPANIASKQPGVVATDVNTVSAAPSAPDHFVITLKTSLGEFTEINGISAYPNPFDDRINVRYSSTEASKLSVALINVQGIKVIETNWIVSAGINDYVLNTEILKPGMYTLVIAGKDGVIRRQFIKVN